MLQDRTRIVPVQGGGRGTPLNAGVDLAVGNYLAVLDDDDVAHQDWVATFRRMAQRHPGSVLRTRVSGERYDPADGVWLREDAEWPECFDLIDHLQVNASPACGLAFPRACFTDFGLRWDESLPVVEDWDLLIRAAALCGVASSPAITAAYRRWNRGDDSLALHTDGEWRAAMRTVVVNADRRPLLLPPGSVTRLRRDRDVITILRQRAAEADEHHQHLILAHQEDLAREHADLEHQRELLAAHQREVADLRERHIRDVATAVTANTQMFHASTSWRITAPIRAIGALRLRLAQHRTATPAAAPEPDGAAPIPLPDSPGNPASGVTLQPPPEPTSRTWPAVQFDQLYAQHPDPWGYTTSWYEQRKYAITLACLPRQRYRRTFEPGCSVGVLSELLAARTDMLISADFSAVALGHARKRLAQHRHVDVRQLSLPAEWPNGTFDLIVISELATYLSDDDLNTLVERTTGSLEPDGTLLLVHFRPDTGTPHTATDVHDRFRRHPGLTQRANHQDEQFILDVLERTAQP